MAPDGYDLSSRPAALALQHLQERTAPWRQVSTTGEGGIKEWLRCLECKSRHLAH
jgi:hypothetical protein